MWVVAVKWGALVDGAGVERGVRVVKGLRWMVIPLAEGLRFWF